MPASIDKNDVDISKLFYWSDKFVLKVKNKDYNIYVRLLGDAEVNRARVHALRKSAELRTKLRDETTDEYYAYVPVFESITEDELINSLILLYTRTYTTDALQEIRLELPVEPSSEASLEKREKYQKEIDEFPDKRDKAVKEYIEKRTKEKKKGLEETSKEDLYKEYTETMINQLCEAELITRFREMCAYFGTYKDRALKKRLFENFEQFNNMPGDVKDQLMDAYQLLEIDSESLKK